MKFVTRKNSAGRRDQKTIFIRKRGTFSLDPKKIEQDARPKAQNLFLEKMFNEKD